MNKQELKDLLRDIEYFEQEYLPHRDDYWITEKLKECIKDEINNLNN